MKLTDENDNRYSLEKGIYEDASWLHSMVENILSLTRIQEGYLKIHKEPEAAEEVVGAAVNAIEKREQGREIRVNMPETFFLIPMDITLINQVLINLLDNALKFTNKDDEISVTVNLDEDKNRAEFIVADEGAGIPENELKDIFKMFYTTKGKNPDTQKGVGLGLAICESVVKAHGGEIKAKNKKDGKGAEFIFWLPLEDEKGYE